MVRKLIATGSQWPLHALAIAVTLILVRLLWVFPLSAVLQRRSGVRPSWRVPAVVSWAGARGVVPLAAALSIPHVMADGTPLGDRDLVVLLTTAVIVITLVVQGFTLAPLVKRAGIALHPNDIRLELTSARLHLAETGLAHLEQLAETEAAPEFAIEQLRHSWRARIQRIQADTEEDVSDTSASYLRLRREILAIESAELTSLYETGVITDTTRRRIQRLLDLEHAGLSDEE